MDWEYHSWGRGALPYKPMDATVLGDMALSRRQILSVLIQIVGLKLIQQSKLKHLKSNSQDRHQGQLLPYAGLLPWCPFRGCPFTHESLNVCSLWVINYLM